MPSFAWFSSLTWLVRANRREQARPVEAFPHWFSKYDDAKRGHDKLKEFWIREPEPLRTMANYGHLSATQVINR